MQDCDSVSHPALDEVGLLIPPGPGQPYFQVADPNHDCDGETLSTILLLQELENYLSELFAKVWITTECQKGVELLCTIYQGTTPFKG